MERSVLEGRRRGRGKKGLRKRNKIQISRKERKERREIEKRSGREKRNRRW